MTQCAAFNCTSEYEVTVWKIPLCKKHWKQCCDEDRGCSIPWLRKNVRSDYKTEFEQYSLRTEKLFRLSYRLSLCAEELLKRARGMVQYSDKNIEPHSTEIEEALSKVAKLEVLVKELSEKIMSVITETDKKLDDAFYRMRRREQLDRQKEQDEGSSTRVNDSNTRPAKSRKDPTSKPFSIADAMANHRARTPIHPG